jgi:hypothetical protein
MGTPSLPIVHNFMHPHYDGKAYPNRYPGGLRGNAYRCDLDDLEAGFGFPMVRYEYGNTLVEWRLPVADRWGNLTYCGTQDQWQNGSVTGRDLPLLWQRGFSSCCRPDLFVGGMALGGSSQPVFPDQCGVALGGHSPVLLVPVGGIALDGGIPAPPVNEGGVALGGAAELVEVPGPMPAGGPAIDGSA